MAERAGVRQSLSDGAPESFRTSHGAITAGVQRGGFRHDEDMVDAGAGASTRLRAADLVYSHALKAIEVEDIDARVTELERAAELAKSSPN